MFQLLYLVLGFFLLAPITATPLPTTTPTLHKRLNDISVVCRNGIFQISDEDIAEDICVVRNRCVGGELAVEEITDEGEFLWATTCVGCPANAEAVTTGCQILGVTPMNITEIAG